MKKIKALVLLSGGLDSILAARLVAYQEIDLVGVAFKSYFFDASQKATVQAKELGIPLKIIDISQTQLDKVLSADYGYGVGLNPCVDCHLLMIKEALALLKKEKADFLVTGDVLGQRPLSQNKKALELIDRVSGGEGLIVRPLSAKKLPITIAEEKGWLDRDKLLSLQGRSRKPQLALAQKWRIKNYSAPAGGCLLTDKNFSQRLFRLWQYFPPQPAIIALASLGRHFWYQDNLVVIGRDEEENEKLANLAQAGDYLIEPKIVPGPTALVKGKSINPETLSWTKKKMTRYIASQYKDQPVVFIMKSKVSKNNPLQVKSHHKN